nr:hypothetical protein [Tanacetum cinerariifolium]
MFRKISNERYDVPQEIQTYTSTCMEIHFTSGRSPKTRHAHSYEYPGVTVQHHFSFCKIIFLNMKQKIMYVHADFGRYLYGLDHMKSRNMITAELKIGEYDRQTATFRPYAAVFLMRIMETYMGKGTRNWDLRLNSNRVKLQKQLTVLCKKYAATILMSDCNVLKEQVKAHMKDTSESMLSDLEMGKGQVVIK